MTLQSIGYEDERAIDEEFEKLSPESKAQVERALRNYERREKRERFGEQERFNRDWGSWMTLGEEFGQ